MIFLIIIIVAAALGGGVVYGFWLTLGVLAFLFYLAVAWRRTQMVFYFLVAYLPFQAALNLSSDVDLMSGRGLILGLFGVWAVKEVYQKRIRLKRELNPPQPLLAEREEKALDFRALFKNHIFIALALFFILSAISIFGAENQIWGLRKLLVFVSIFPLFLLTGALIKSKKDAQTLVYVIIGGATFSAMIALAQFLAQFVFGLEEVMNFWAARIIPLFSGASFGSLVASNPSWLVNIGGQTIVRAIGLFPDPHILAFYLGLTLPFSLAVMIFGNFEPGISLDAGEKNTASPQSSSQQRRGGNTEFAEHLFILFIVNCLLLIVLLLTFSRGGYLGLLFSLAVFVFFAWQRFDSKDKKFFGATVLLAAVILLLVGRPVANRLISSFDAQEGSNLGRLAIWQDSRQIIKKNPITGVGLGNYSLAVSFSQDYRNAVTSHNLYLDIWAETGIFALLAWLFMFVAAVREAYKKIKNLPVIVFGCLTALSYFFAHSFFETPIFNPTALAFLMVVLGLAAVQTTDYE